MTSLSELINSEDTLHNKENNSQLNNNTNLPMANYEKEKLNNKIYLIQKKFEIKEAEYITKINLLNNQLQLMKQTQLIIKNKLEIKDKAILEFNNIIKDYQIELLKYKQELDIKNNKYIKYKEKLKSIKLKNSSSSDLCLSSYDKNIYDIKMKELIESINDKNEKMKEMQDKINEFDIIKNELIIKNKHLENKNKEYNKTNEELKNKLEENQKEINNLNENHKKIELSFVEKNNLLEEKIKEINSKNENIINKVNENIESICNWLENDFNKDNTNLKINEDNNKTILNNSKEEFNKINFEKLMKSLENIKIKNIEEKKLLEIRIQKEIDDIIKKEKYNELNNEIYKLYNKLKQEIQETKLFDLKEENNNKELIIVDLEKIINEYINHMNKFIEENKNKENLSVRNKILEKKIKNLETNNELKQMEINSLQEIIERRANINVNINNSQNIDDFLNSTNNSIKSQTINEIKYNFTK